MTKEDAVKILECMSVDLVGTLTDMSKKSPLCEVIEQRIAALDVAKNALVEICKRDTNETPIPLETISTGHQPIRPGGAE